MEAEKGEAIRCFDRVGLGQLHACSFDQFSVKMVGSGLDANATIQEMVLDKLSTRPWSK